MLEEKAISKSFIHPIIIECLFHTCYYDDHKDEVFDNKEHSLVGRRQTINQINS